MIYCFDIDGTICTLMRDSNYMDAKPYRDVLEEINRLYHEGHTIKLFTARGCKSGKDWTFLTMSQLQKWGVKYHELIMNKKPHYDLYIGDKAENAIEWRKNIGQLPKIGFVASSFDLIHPGYVLMLDDAKTVCEHLICALQTDPTVERKHKNKPVQTLEERKLVLESLKQVDQVVTYTTEEELIQLLKEIQPDVRILGTDYYGTKFTGHELNIPIHWHERRHDWSTSSLRRRVAESEKSK